MFNENNIKALEDANIHYILEAKLKQYSKEQQSLILDKSKKYKKNEAKIIQGLFVSNTKKMTQKSLLSVIHHKELEKTAMIGKKPWIH